MSDIAIRVENLSKAYQITHSGRSKYRTLQEDVIGFLKRPFSRDAERPRRETFWALKDVSFEVKHGEVLGIIGRNGAGKSTLLKILSRITKPTSGYAEIYGRVGSLLEVGTGFHPELTGRENIFLNGAVLGMSRRDIQKHFDEIVAFADVEQFLDTPAKRYSSGMYMRLAFAVAAHLEPEVLVVDEVLAVGDAEFQKKCLGKMSEVAKSGRTVLFVSHNMAAVSNLCSRAILLNQGVIRVNSKVSDTVSAYLSTNRTDGQATAFIRRNPPADSRAYFRTVSITGLHSPTSGGTLVVGEDAEIKIHLSCKETIRSVVICAVIWDLTGVRLIDVNTGMKGEYLTVEANTDYEISFELNNVLLRPAMYRLELYLGIENQESIDHIPEALIFEVLPNYDQPSGFVDYPGHYRCRFQYSINEIVSQC